MPGLSFIYDSEAGLEYKGRLIRCALDSLIHFSDYKRDVLLEDKFYFLGCTTYKEYPVATFENDEYLIYLEGKIYGLSIQNVEKELVELANIAMSTANQPKFFIAERLLNMDGDFIVFILDKKFHRIVVLNDALARLPLYICRSKGQLILSRELAFIQKVSDKTALDRIAIAQYLLFGYPLGKRTLMEDIHRVAPATLISIDARNSKIEIENIHRFNFEEKKYSFIKNEENARQLVDLFDQSSRQRTLQENGYRNILSLSGGRDSISVAAALKRGDIPFCAATFLTHGKNNINDVESASMIADRYNIQWKLFALAPPKGKDYLTLLRIKQGLNYLGMSFILSFFERIKDTYGTRLVYLTGDGGDKLLPDLRPSRKVKNTDALVKYIISANQVFPLSAVAQLTGATEADIVEELRNHILSYPEKDCVQKYVHFVICERGFKWLFEGEDRNRCYFWSASPFWSMPFLHYAMNCPDDQKKKYGLYNNFLNILISGQMNNDYRNLRIPVTTGKFIIKNVFVLLPPGMKLAIKKYLLKNAHCYGNNSDIMNCFREQLRTSPVSDYLKMDAARVSSYDKFQINNLFSITSLIAEIKGAQSALKTYCDCDFV